MERNSTENVENVPMEGAASLPEEIPPISEDNTGQTKPKDKSGKKLDIQENIEDVIVLENETALFECKVLQDLEPASTWYKDGNLLQSDKRTTITQDNTWHRLEIKQVTASDQGIYIKECINEISCMSTKVHLYVIPRSINDGVFYHKIKYQEPGLIQHLKDVKVFKGENIELKAEFSYASEIYLWFKNNDAILCDKRTTILYNGTSASLTIKDAKPTDTGVYFIVAKTVQGYLSSFADVMVGGINVYEPVLPIIEECLPDEVEALVGEELRLIIKAQTDINTNIIWEQNGIEIDPNNCKQVDYGNNYIGLTIPNPNMSSAGEYRVILENDHNHRSSDTLVNFSLPPEPLSEVKLVHTLESAVACCGSKVSFDCSFDLGDQSYFFVVWYIGRYKVERTNSLFNVIWSGNHFMLYIKQFEPGMAGEVICELRQAFPEGNSVMMKRAYANLMMVPPAFIEAAKQRPMLCSKLYCEQDLLNISTRIEATDIATCSVADILETDAPWTDKSTPCLNPFPNPPDANASTSSKEAELASGMDTNFYLKIVYCRLDDDGLYFLHATRGSNTAMTTQLTVYEDPATFRMVTVILWGDSLHPLRDWYSIEIEQADGSFTEAGRTSHPQFELKNPPLDRMLIFRIKLVQPMNQVYDSKVHIVPPPEEMPPLAISEDSTSINSYVATYTNTCQVIGKGSYGTVTLVRDNKGVYYAAKIVYFFKRKHNKLMEYDIMKNLQHPKVAQLIGFYRSKFTQIFIMDYYWGGELFYRIITEEYLSEVDVIVYIKQVCEALDYLHAKSIAHLDVKPENIMCVHPNSRQIKLIDFGMSKWVIEEDNKGCYQGTKEYLAPEVVSFGSVSTATDMWSLGVVTYTLLSGLVPFVGETWLECSININLAKYDFDHIVFNDVSDLAKHFVNCLLIKDACYRMRAGEAIHHKWIQDGPPKGTKTKRLVRMRENMRTYLSERSLRYQRDEDEVSANQRRQDPTPHDETPQLDPNNMNNN